MKRPIVVRPAAQADISEAARLLESSRPGLGRRFLVRLQQALEQIETMPELYGVVWQDVRAARLNSFRHLVYDIVFPDRVEVLAVMHWSQNGAA